MTDEERAIVRAGLINYAIVHVAKKSRASRGWLRSP